MSIEGVKRGGVKGAWQEYQHYMTGVDKARKAEGESAMPGNFKGRKILKKESEQTAEHALFNAIMKKNQSYL